VEPILTRFVREPNAHTLDFYVKHHGYEALRKALAMQPNDIIDADFRPVSNGSSC
jgi:NADH-quinone oxidoreductase subunit F